LEFQQQAREMLCPQKLYQLWEDVCRRYERREIGLYEVEEMKEVIWPLLTALSSIRRIVDGAEETTRRPVRRRA
jgi:hypothetical protein